VGFTIASFRMKKYGNFFGKLRTGLWLFPVRVHGSFLFWPMVNYVLLPDGKVFSTQKTNKKAYFRSIEPAAGKNKPRKL
jgi:hypothetical protein